MVALHRTCRNFHRITNIYGYVRRLTLCMTSDYMNLVTIWAGINLRSIRSVTVSDMSNPSSWLPFSWPEQVTFRDCRLFSTLTPPLNSRTKFLKLHDSSRRVIRIDWDKFPDLEVLDLNSFDVDLKGIEKCTNLKKIRLNFRNSFHRKLPPSVASLKYLTRIISNLTPNSRMHFVSPFLNCCLVPKRKVKTSLRQGYYSLLPEAFTSNSVSIPRRHLTDQTYVNCAAFEL